jgi:hypothetical protein
MKTIYIDEKDLADLLRLAYQEGVYGYMDLCEAVVERIISNYEARPNKKPVQPSLFDGVRMDGGAGYVDVRIDDGSVYTPSNLQYASPSNLHWEPVSFMTASGNTISLSDTTLTGDIQVYQQQLIRDSQII